MGFLIPVWPTAQSAIFDDANDLQDLSLTEGHLLTT